MEESEPKWPALVRAEQIFGPRETYRGAAKNMPAPPKSCDDILVQHG